MMDCEEYNNSFDAGDLNDGCILDRVPAHFILTYFLPLFSSSDASTGN